MDPEYFGYLLTWNPQRWDDQGWFADSVARTQRREAPNASRWSSGGRKYGYLDGDRVFLLKQGAEPRGIVASGWVDHAEGTYEDEHWDGSGRLTSYIDIDWEYFVEQDRPLPITELAAAAPHTGWRPQASGAMIAAEDLAEVERLWAQHTGLTAPDPRPGKEGHRTAGRQRPRSAGWQRDPELRRRAEDYAQCLLEEHYRRNQWDVEDTRFGNPFDAIARKGREIRYLEAKGTVSDGEQVLVTAGEVRFAWENSGMCVIGIVSGIRFGEDRKVIPDSGALVMYDWSPDPDDLVPVTFKWLPPR